MKDDIDIASVTPLQRDALQKLSPQTGKNCELSKMKIQWMDIERDNLKA